MNTIDYSCCTPEEISRLVSSIDSHSDHEWKDHIERIYVHIQNREQTEAFGKAASASQILHLLRYSEDRDTLHHEKLSHVLVGMRHEVFRDVIQQATPEEFRVLKLEAVTEPIQHHLTLFTHEMSNQIQEYTNTIIELENEVQLLNPNSFKRAELDDLLLRIYNASLFAQEELQDTNALLALAWNTNRTDLIEKLSAIKDVYQKFSSYIVGYSRQADENPTGLYAKLESQLLSVYGNPENLHDIEAVQDDEPAIEALSKLGIWYLKDYWELGLLPLITKVEKLNLGPDHTEAEQAAFREKLFDEARKNLEKAGLKSVKDLKKAFIFSRETLREYLS